MVRERGCKALAGSVGVFHNWRGFGQWMDDVPEAAWILAEEYWGKGYAGEAMRAVLAWIDEAHTPQRIACMVAKANCRSLRLAERLGFNGCGEQDYEGETLVLLERLRSPG